MLVLRNQNLMLISEKQYCNIILRFGYNDHIELEPDALVAPLSSSPGSNVELTHAGMDFLLQVKFITKVSK